MQDSSRSDALRPYGRNAPLRENNGLPPHAPHLHPAQLWRHLCLQHQHAPRLPLPDRLLRLSRPSHRWRLVSRSVGALETSLCDWRLGSLCGLGADDGPALWWVCRGSQGMEVVDLGAGVAQCGVFGHTDVLSARDQSSGAYRGPSRQSRLHWVVACADIDTEYPVPESASASGLQWQQSIPESRRARAGLDGREELHSRVSFTSVSIMLHRAYLALHEHVPWLDLRHSVHLVRGVPIGFQQPVSF